MNVRFVIKQSIAPFIVAAALGLGFWVFAGFASAKSVFCGGLLVAVALLVSGGFFARMRVSSAGAVLLRLAVSSALKWLILMGGAAVALTQGGVVPAPFTFGVIAGLVSTVFNLASNSSTREAS
ncbi:MAG: hypothetical protein Q7J29_05820 [Stagnimonas sp.]|nr:hypothetical protein [Stagnimonas sp.]